MQLVCFSLFSLFFSVFSCILGAREKRNKRRTQNAMRDEWKRKTNCVRLHLPIIYFYHRILLFFTAIFCVSFFSLCALLGSVSKALAHIGVCVDVHFVHFQTANVRKHVSAENTLTPRCTHRFFLRSLFRVCCFCWWSRRFHFILFVFTCLSQASVVTRFDVLTFMRKIESIWFEKCVPRGKHAHSFVLVTTITKIACFSNQKPNIVSMYIYRYDERCSCIHQTTEIN